MRYRVPVLLLLIPLLTPSLQAGFIFGRKKDKIDPKQRVPELVQILKTDKDADKRSKAAEELRNFDPAQFPEIIPALIDALQNDAKPGVRVDAAQTLGKLRPVSQTVGEALENAQNKDSSMRVRLQARSALLQYYWAGYRSTKKPDVPAPPTSREPPLAGSGKYPPAIDTKAPASGSRLTPTPVYSPYGARPTPPVSPPNVSTKEPPIAPPLESPVQLAPPPAAPPGPTFPSPAAPPAAPPAPPPSAPPSSVGASPPWAAPLLPPSAVTPAGSSLNVEEGPKLP